jgi:hypothetical protein
VDHRGSAGSGLGFDPRDFFSTVVVTICKSNVKCGGVPAMDSKEVVVSRVFQKGGLGVFIRSPEGLEPASAKFQWKDDEICDFASDYLDFLWRNTQPGRIEEQR